jgi:hypothetical protein
MVNSVLPPRPSLSASVLDLDLRDAVILEVVGQPDIGLPPEYRPTPLRSSLCR